MCFNVGRATHWAIADGLGVNPKADPETIGLAILILGLVAKPSLCPGIFDRELGGHCTHDGFCMHLVLLAYMVVFGQRRAMNLGPPVSSSTLYRPGKIIMFKILPQKEKNVKSIWFITKFKMFS